MAQDSKFEIPKPETQNKKNLGGKQVLVFEWLNQKEKLKRTLHKDRVVLGSVVSADVCLSGAGISPIHAIVEVEVDPVSGMDHGVLYDLASTSGTWVGSERVITKSLKNGDIIRIGDNEIRFELRDVDSMSLNHPFHEIEGRKLFIDHPEEMGALLLVNEHDAEEIFDYKSTNKKAVEVIFAWMDTVLDTQHFVDQKKVTIGSAIENDFGIPGLQNDPFVLIEHPGEDFILNIPPQMDGVVQRQGGIQSIDSVGKSITLKSNDLVKLKLGDLRIYVNTTSAPPTLKRKRLLDRDPLFFRILFISFLVTFSVLFTLFKIPVTQELDVEEVPERIATILYQPEKYMIRRLPSPEEKNKPEISQANIKKEVKKIKLEIKPGQKPLPKIIPKEMDVGEKNKIAQAKARAGQKESKEGEGARAKGKEGRRGTKTANAGKEAQNKAMRPSPNSGTGQGGAASEVPDQGNVNLLKGAVSQIENVLGASAESLGKSGSKLKGFGGFDTRGSGGLALSGSGSGGGGDAAGLGGLGSKGRGGGRVGTGLGAAGSGSGIVGGKTRVELRRGGPEETVVMGSIDPSLIEAAIMEHRDEFRLCYEREINAENPNQSGRVGTSFVIGASGRVTQAGVVSSSLNNSNIERCILQVLKRIQFPVPRGAGIIEVKYPFKFSSG